MELNLGIGPSRNLEFDFFNNILEHFNTSLTTWLGPLKTATVMAFDCLIPGFLVAWQPRETRLIDKAGIAGILGWARWSVLGWLVVESLLLFSLDRYFSALFLTLRSNDCRRFSFHSLGLRQKAASFLQAQVDNQILQLCNLHFEQVVFIFKAQF